MADAAEDAGDRINTPIPSRPPLRDVTKGLFVGLPDAPPMSAERLAAWIRANDGSVMIGFKPATAQPSAVTGWIPPVTKKDALRAHGVIEGLGGEIIQAYRNVPAVHAKLPAEAVAALATHPLVNYIRPNTRGVILAQDTTWGQVKIDAPEAWWNGYKGGNTHVTIIDTGLDFDHYSAGDVDPNRVTNCAYVDRPYFDDCWDDVGHGTFIHGIIAANDNEIGHIGTAPQTLIASLKACRPPLGVCEASDIASALDWAADQVWSRHVVNMSLGFPPDADSMTNEGGLVDFVAAAYNAGVLLVASAGLASWGAVGYPAAFDNVIAVSGTLEADTLATGYLCDREIEGDITVGSATGSQVELAAPFHTRGLWNDGAYELGCGTSVSSAYVSAVAAITWGVFTAWSRNAIRSRLQSTAIDLGAAGRDSKYGYGRVDVMRAVEGNPLRAEIGGESWVQPNQTCTWFGSYEGGTGPYTFKWLRDGNVVGTNINYTGNTGSENFLLSFEVTDTFNDFTTGDDLSVTVSWQGETCGI